MDKTSVTLALIQTLLQTRYDVPIEDIIAETIKLRDSLFGFKDHVIDYSKVEVIPY